VQLDLAKAGIVTYGFDRLPTYAQAGPPQPEQSRLARAFAHGLAAGTVYVLQLSLSPTAANVSVCVYTATQGFTLPVRISSVLDRTGGPWSRPETSHDSGEEQIRKAILEMRPARRSLQDKSSEELSEFEREYPW
jgi:hypothetical protein